MTEPTKIIYNTLEQVASDDLNLTGTLAGRAAMDTELANVGGMTATPASVVRRGLVVISDGPASMAVLIGPGEVMQHQAGVGAPSEYKLGATSGTKVPLTAADLVNPRIDRISSVITSVATGPTVRLVLTLPSRAVAPVVVDKIQDPGLQMVRSTGVVAPLPFAPATPAGNIPICDVLVPAGALGIDDNHIMDLRREAAPHGVVVDHSVAWGMGVGGFGGGTLVINPGRCTIAGKLIDFGGTTYTAALYAAPLNGPFMAFERRYVYLVAPGPNSPVGKNIGSFVLTISTIAPDYSTRRPSVPVSYNPLVGVAGAPAGLYALTSDALFIGAIVLDATAQPAAGALALTSSRAARAIDAVFGIFPAASGHIKAPRFSWVSVNTVKVGPGSFVLNGSPLQTTADVTAAMPTRLAANDGPALTSTWYYTYLRSAVSQDAIASLLPVCPHVIPVLSRFAPNALLGKPTPEPGFVSADYIFVGSVYRDALGNFLEFHRDGSTVLWAAPESIGAGTYNQLTIPLNPLRVALLALCPESSRMALLTMRGVLRGIPQIASTPGSLLARIGLFAKSALPTPLYLMEMVINSQAATAAQITSIHNWAPLAIPISNVTNGCELALMSAWAPAAATWDVLTTGFILSTDQLGYVEDYATVTPP